MNIISDVYDIRARDRLMRLLPFIAFILLDLLLVGRYFFVGSVMNHGDLSHPYCLDTFINNYKYLFYDNSSLSNMESVNRAVIVLPIAYSLKLLGLQLTKYFYATVFFGLLLFSQINFKIFLEKLFSISNSVSVISASIFFSLSPWVLEQYQAVLFWMAYAFFPLFFVGIVRLIEERGWYWPVLSAVALTCIGTTPHYFIFACLAGIIILFYYTLFDRRYITWAFFRRGLIFAGVFLAANMYWLVTVAAIVLHHFSVTPGYTNQASFVDLFSRNSSVLNVFQGQEQWIYWYQNDNYLWSLLHSPIWILSSFVPVLILVVLLFSRVDKRQRLWNMFSILFLFFFTLTLGNWLPFYKWLSLDAPVISSFGWIMRVPGKFSFMVWLFLALGVAIYISETRNRAIIALVTVSLLIFSFPKTFEYFGFYYLPAEFPQSHIDAINYLSSSTDKTILVAPFEYGFGKNSLNYEASFTWNPDRIATNIMPTSFLSPSVGYYHLTFRNWQTSLYANVYPEFTGSDPNSHIPQNVGQKYLGPANIRYLLYHNDIVGAGDKGLEAVNFLKNSTDLRFVKSFGSDVYLFENPFLEPILRAQDPTIAVTASKVNPTKCSFELTNSTSTILLFAQVYDAYWLAYLSNGDVITPKMDPDNGLIRFMLPPGSVKGEIIYVPQLYYQPLLPWSLFAFIISVLSLSVPLFTGASSKFPRNLIFRETY